MWAQSQLRPRISQLCNLCIGTPKNIFFNSVYGRVRFLNVTICCWWFFVGLDRYHAGARYPILSATAIPIPIPAVQFFCNESAIFLYIYAGYMCKNTVQALNYRRALQQCWLLRQMNEQQGYWYRRRYSTKSRPIPTNIGEYRPIPDTGISLALIFLLSV